MPMTQRAIVTGASSGIGAEFVRQLAAKGWTVTVVARNLAALDALVRALPGSGHEVVIADLATDEGVARVCAAIEKTHYHLLVNNAGLGAAGLFDSEDADTLRAIVQVNVEAVYRIAHAYLRSAKSGDALINTASCEGLIPFPGQAAYAASKAFVTSLSESLWYEQRPRGVYVMGLCPGMTKTPMVADPVFDAVPKMMIGSPELVVSTALRALRRRKKPIVIPGWVNRAWIFSMRLLTRRAQIRMSGAMVPKQLLSPAAASPTARAQRATSS
jgi:short-subunit dehydrogenase